MSVDIKMAWRNIWRNPRRSVLTIAAIAFACLLLVFMLSWQFGSYDTMINTSVKIHTGHLQVQAQGYNEKRDIRLVIPDPEPIRHVMKSIPEVAAYTFRANAFSLVSSRDRTYGVLVVGIDPAGEKEVSTLKRIVQRGDYLDESDSGAALVGELLAENLHVDLGDELVLLGQGRDGSVAATVVTIKGLYRSGQDDFDRSALHITLKNFQDTYFMRGAVHECVVLSASLHDVAMVKERVMDRLGGLTQRHMLVVLDWMDLMPGLKEAIQMDLYSGLIFYLILIVVVTFSILNTFLMAVFERTREFGVLLSIGTRPGRLSKILLIESTAMTLIGIVLGIIAGCLITWYFQNHGIVISGTAEVMRQFGLPERMYPRLSFYSISIGPAAVMIITFITALYPALKVRKLKPVEAMAGR
jgi:putative ABC transport system permease protein